MTTNASKDHVKDLHISTLEVIGTGKNAVNIRGSIMTSNGKTLRAHKQFKPLTFPKWFDLTTLTPGGADLRGFRGAFTDDVWLYLVPNRFSSTILSGKVARILLNDLITTNDFTNNPPYVERIDLSISDSDFKGFYGGFTDGCYAYFIPSFNVSFIPNGKIVRLRTDIAWWDSMSMTTTSEAQSSVEYIDLALYDTKMKGFFDGFFDGTYGYLVPSNTGSPPLSGTAARIDLKNASWTTAGDAQIIPIVGVTGLDMRSVDPDLSGFWGGFTDGIHAYFVPHFNDAYSGKIARVPLNNFVVTAVESLDLTQINPLLKGFRGGFTDGKYGYFIPYFNNRDPINFPSLSPDYHGNFVRVDLENFNEAIPEKNKTIVNTLNLQSINDDYKGFELGFITDRYAFLAPNQGNSSGTLIRVDLDNFNKNHVSALDLTTFDSTLVGYTGGATFNNFIFLSPSSTQGNLIRLCCQ